MTEMILLDKALAAAGAGGWGVADYSALLPGMSPDAVARAKSLCPGAASVIIAAFPYYAGDRPGNLSLYARGEDYHRVLTRRLSGVCEALAAHCPQNRFVPGADNSPLPERSAAGLAGLGLRGANGLVILPPYGSYVFLGTILTDLALPFKPGTPAPDCISCGKCAAACPTGALGGHGFDESRCLSSLTQKKGELTPMETDFVAQHPCAWGCDLCQRVCPYNSAPEKTKLPEFQDALIDFITPEMVEGLTNRTFQAAYGDRAFAWRGPGILRRNLALQAGKEANNG